MLLHTVLLFFVIVINGYNLACLMQISRLKMLAGNIVLGPSLSKDIVKVIIYYR